MSRCLGILTVYSAICICGQIIGAQTTKFTQPPLKIPDGYEIELVAGPPLVERPMFAGLDERGRLLVCDSAGVNWKVEELLKNPPHRLRLLEDTDGDGKFDKSTVFADKLAFPEGAMFHEGAWYVACPPVIYRFEDTNGDGVADKKTEWAKSFALSAMGNDLHGPFAGPDGRWYWTKGGFVEHDVKLANGKQLKGKSSAIFRAKPDGSEVERFLGAGMDDPVEIAFTPEGEVIFTCTFYTNPSGGLRDGLIHGVWGGAYPKYHGLTDELKKTGDLLPAMTHQGVAAPVGLMRYDGDVFGADFRGNLFSTCFNLHSVQRHVVERFGGTFKTVNSDFVSSTSVDFHPTDVLEDADGSMLVVDTGGWFRIACPTSQIARPEILGGIYRVKRKGIAKVEDPRGQRIIWPAQTHIDLTILLEDGRAVVRERAIRELARRGTLAVSTLADTLARSLSVEIRRNAVWALCRMESADARATARKAIDDASPSVRQAAIHSAGLSRDAAAIPQLVKRVGTDEMAIRRESATALGRMGKKEAIGALLDAVCGDIDRMAEHAMIYALIEIGESAALMPALQDSRIGARRAALIALDQMENSPLTVTQVAPFLRETDLELRKTATDVLVRHPQWADGVITDIWKEFDREQPTPASVEQARRLLVAMCRTSKGRSEVSRLADNPGGQRPDAMAVLLEVMAEADVNPWPKEWPGTVARQLQGDNQSVVHQAILTARAAGSRMKDADVKSAKLPDALLRIAGDANRPEEVRLAALSAAARWIEKLDPSAFELVRDALAPEQPAESRINAVDTLSQATLSDEQLTRLTELLAGAGALELPRLLAAFEKSKTPAVGAKLLASLRTAPAARNLRWNDVQRVLNRYSPELAGEARVFFDTFAPTQQSQLARIHELQTALSSGDARRGGEVFYSAKASCTTCHAVDRQGGQIGPDMTKIGSVRTGRDILESLVAPSASFARGYEPWIVNTRDKEIHSGIIANESADAIDMITGPRERIRILRSNIVKMRPSEVSIMPEGLDTQLSKQEIADLVAYLLSLK